MKIACLAFSRIANFDRILFEDTQFAPYIQESTESPGFEGVREAFGSRPKTSQGGTIRLRSNPLISL